MSESMDKVGFSSQEKDNLFRIVATIMHLGNIAFEEELDDKKGGLGKIQLEVECASRSNLDVPDELLSSIRILFAVGGSKVASK